MPWKLLALSVVGTSILSVGWAFQATPSAVATKPAPTLPLTTPQLHGSLGHLQHDAVAGPALVEASPSATGFLYENTTNQTSESIVLTVQNLGDTAVTFTIGTGNTTVEVNESRGIRMTVPPGNACGSGLVCWTAGTGTGTCRFAWVIRR
jgi:hypothetical protein